MATSKKALARWNDSMTNLVSGLGVRGVDKSVSTQYGFVNLTDDQLIKAYRGDWIARKIIDIPAHDATREWRVWEAEDDQITFLEEAERDLNVKSKVRDALIKARLFGGSVILMGVRSDDPSKELKPESVKKGDLKFLHVASRLEITAGELETDPMSVNYGTPKHYEFSASSSQTKMGNMTIHPSRVVRFIGNPIPITLQAQGWGDSVLLANDDAIKQAGTVNAALAVMINECKTDVLQIPDLMQNLATEEYETQLMARLQLASTAKSIVNTLILDKEEVWQRIQTNFSGLGELLSTFLTIASGAADIPATRMLGQSAKGLNATGESDMRNYYDMVAAQQENVMRPAMKIMDEVLIRHAIGDRPEEVSYEWAPLWQLDEETKAKVMFNKAQTFALHHDSGLIDPTALADALVNQLVEDNVYPGLQQSLLDSAKTTPGFDPAMASSNPSIEKPLTPQEEAANAIAKTKAVSSFGRDVPGKQPGATNAKSKGQRTAPNTDAVWNDHLRRLRDDPEKTAMGRCMERLKGKFPDQQQRLAVCYSEIARGHSDFNPYHEPGGSEHGGEFASTPYGEEYGTQHGTPREHPDFTHGNAVVHRGHLIFQNPKTGEITVEQPRGTVIANVNSLAEGIGFINGRLIMHGDFNPYHEPAGSEHGGEFAEGDGVFWHGSPSGELHEGTTGIHVGTKEAAKEALEARIGVPARGEWDGTREYGKTLLAGTDTLDAIEAATGHFKRTGYNVDAPKHDYFPTKMPTYSDKTSVSPQDFPSIVPYRIVGGMTNSPQNPHDDFKANGYMKASLARGNAKNGFFYKNISEDEGSISAVVPSAKHLVRLPTGTAYRLDFNPYHVPSGEHGGEFTTGTSANAPFSKEEEEIAQTAQAEGIPLTKKQTKILAWLKGSNHFFTTKAIYAAMARTGTDFAVGMAGAALAHFFFGMGGPEAASLGAAVNHFADSMGVGFKAGREFLVDFITHAMIDPNTENVIENTAKEMKIDSQSLDPVVEDFLVDLLARLKVLKDEPVLDYNPYHEPAGTESGGRFAESPDGKAPKMCDYGCTPKTGCLYGYKDPLRQCNKTSYLSSAERTKVRKYISGPMGGATVTRQGYPGPAGSGGTPFFRKESPLSKFITWLPSLGDYNPNHVPAGNPDGGQFTTGTGHVGLTTAMTRSLEDSGGFTFNAHGGTPKEGYAVGGYDGKPVWDESLFSERDAGDFLRENSKLLGSGAYHVGGWKEGGKVYLDVVKVFGSRRGAVKAGKRNNQIAIADLKRISAGDFDHAFIPTGGTGDEMPDDNEDTPSDKIVGEFHLFPADVHPSVLVALLFPDRMFKADYNHCHEPGGSEIGGEFCSEGGGGGSYGGPGGSVASGADKQKAEEMQTTARDLIKQEFGLDPDTLTVTPNVPDDFYVGGARYVPSGHTADDGKITLYSKNLSKSNYHGIVRHEAMHAKIIAYMKKHPDFYDKLDYAKLQKEDGVTSYSTQYWSAPNPGQSAVNETLAEMARVGTSPERPTFTKMYNDIFAGGSILPIEGKPGALTL